MSGRSSSYFAPSSAGRSGLSSARPSRLPLPRTALLDATARRVCPQGNQRHGCSAAACKGGPAGFSGRNASASFRPSAGPLPDGIDAPPGAAAPASKIGACRRRRTPGWVGHGLQSFGPTLDETVDHRSCEARLGGSTLRARPACHQDRSPRRHIRYAGFPGFNLALGRWPSPRRSPSTKSDAELAPELPSCSRLRDVRWACPAMASRVSDLERHREAGLVLQSPHASCKRSAQPVVRATSAGLRLRRRRRRPQRSRCRTCGGRFAWIRFSTSGPAVRQKLRSTGLTGMACVRVR